MKIQYHIWDTEEFTKKYTLIYINISKLEGYCLKFNVWLGKNDVRSIAWNVVSLSTLAHDLINFLHYEHWTDKQKYFYV